MEIHDAFLLALIGGIVPAVLWLKFWLKEDAHREPRGVIAGSFLAGIVTVFFAIPLEQSVIGIFEDYSFQMFLVWAFIEEGLKLWGAYFAGIRKRFNDEPIDATIYLISSALGFAALENMLFVFEPFATGEVANGFITLNLRFIGATLLHVICSGIIGIMLGEAFYKSKKIKSLFLIAGLFIATILHAIFNTLIIKLEENTLFVFGIVWIGLIVVIIILEKIKKIKQII